MNTRTEKDSLGEVPVAEHVYWGAQTERARHHFTIGQEEMPKELILALVLIKKAAALVNCKVGLLSQEKRDLILLACDELLSGQHLDQFPLHIWQTGSGTQTNMNVNEVIANRAIELAGGTKGSKKPIHPNDDVNMSQSTNDVFPSAIHIAAALKIEHTLRPALKLLHTTLQEKERQFAEIIKVGRTHMMDAVPLTLGQEFSGYRAQIEMDMQALDHASPALLFLALGGTAVGTGLNAPKNFGAEACGVLSDLTDLQFLTAPNKFAALASHEPLLLLSGTLKCLATSLFKIANDIRLAGSGPRAGLAELLLPENEPGSSIMPGKVNPTQCEAVTMVAVQVMGLDASLTFANALGHFELNVMKPLIGYNLLTSIGLLADAITSFVAYCLKDLDANKEHITHVLAHSLMIATALNPIVGYDKAAEIVKKAHKEHISLKAAAIALGHMTEEEFDQAVDLKKLVQQ